MGTRARDYSRSGLGGGGSSNITIADILPYLTTSNVKELLGNVYFTNARAFANLELASINALADVITLGPNVTAQVGYVLTWNGNIWTPNVVRADLSNQTTDNLREGTSNLYYTNARVRSAIGAANPTIIYDPFTGLISANLVAVALSANTTDSIPEGFVNFYYSNARAFANLQQASINDLRDVNFAYGAPDQNGKALVWDANSNVWIAGTPNTGAAFFAQNAENANTVSTIGNFSTDDLSEGANNLYFTTARVANAMAGISINALSDVYIAGPNLVIGRLLGWNGSFWEPLDGANISGVATSTFAENSDTSNIAGFANTAGLANVASFANIAQTANVVNFANIAQTANVTNFANTAGNANAALFANLADVANTAVFANTSNLASFVSTLSNFTTDDLRETVGNLYYSNARVLSALNTYSVNVFADVDTTNAQIGAILVYDGNIWLANNIVGQSLQALSAANADSANTVRSISNFSTDDLREGNVNLYFTTTRANDVILPYLIDKNVTLNDLTVNGNLTVQGDTVTLNVANLETQAKNLILGKNAGSTEGIGLEFDGAANIRFSQLNDGQITVDKGLEIRGNILPAINGVYSIGSLTRKWRSIFIGANTIYLGDLALSQNPAGGLSIVDGNTGKPAPVELSNVSATQFVTVNRVGDANEEINSYIGGNTTQFINGVTGNLYFGISANANTQAFSGMLINQSLYDGSNTETNIIFSNLSNGRTEKTSRLSLLGDGNIPIEGHVTVNGNTITQIARYSITTDSNIITVYSNTTPAVEYNNTSGLMKISQDGIYEITTILTISTEWQNTPVEAAFLPTGTYIVQIKANDSSVGGGHNNEYYSGIMSWFSEETDSLIFDEVSMHRAGAGPGSGALFLRIQRTATTGVDNLILQIAGVTNNVSSSSYTFKFRRLL